MNLLDTSCIVTLSDPELAVESNAFDRMTIIANAFALLLAVLLALVVWNAFFAEFLPMPLAVLLAFLVAGIVFALDQRMGASDWELAGVLRQGPLPPSWWAKLAARVAVAFFLAYATAIGMTLSLFHASIDAYLQEKRSLTNSAIEAEYAKSIDDARARLIAPLEAELLTVNTERDQLLKSFQANQKASLDAQDRASRARIEAGREEKGGKIDGVKYVPGKGTLWEEATRQQAEADRLATIGANGAQASQLRLDEVKARVDTKFQQLNAANLAYESERARLETKKLNDPRYVPKRDDPLMRFMALSELETHPTYGAAVQKFSLIAKAVLLTLELAFFMIKIVFAPASVYTVRLITRTKLEAMQVASGYGEKRDEKRQQHRKLRVIAGGDDKRPADDDKRRAE